MQQLETWPDDIYLSLNDGGQNESEVRQDLRDQLILFIRDYKASVAAKE